MTTHVPFGRIVKPAAGAGFVMALLVAAGTTTKYLLSGGSNPGRLLNYVASGAFGADAFSPEHAGTMAILGAAFHVVVSMGWSFFLFVLYAKTPIDSWRWGVVGPAYGIFIWCIMVFVIMPLSRTPGLELDLKTAIIDIGLLVCCAGLPTAFLATRSMSRRPARPDASSNSFNLK